jgi:hypothetical protein
MKKILLILLLLQFYSCSDEKTPVKTNKQVKTGNVKIDLWTDVKTAEDSLYSKKSANKAKNIHYMSYFSKLTEFYTQFPSDPKADSCLFAICATETGFPIGHSKHIALQEQYGDTLLLKYPKSKFRIMTIQNLIYLHDQAIKNRNTKKLDYYYNLILNDSLTSKEEKEEIKIRLKTIDKPIDFTKK